MRRLFAVALLLVSGMAVAQDAPKPIAIAVEPLGDSEHGVVARVSFRFANPRAITEAGLFLDGSFAQAGRVPRSFRFSVPRKHDRMIWNNSVVKNGKLVRSESWSVLPDQRNQLSTVHTFAEGEVEIDVWLVLEGDRDGAPVTAARATQTFSLAKSGIPFVEDREPVSPEAPAPAEASGAVTIRDPRRNGASTLYLFEAEVRPPVKRVEFWVGNKRILARTAPPYTAELDLGDPSRHAALRAIGYDASGRYVDADAFVLDDLLSVTLTRVVTPDGFSHFKLSVHNPKGTPLKSVALYAGDQKLYEWDQPPFALSLSTASLAGAEYFRAVVVDESGAEVSDRVLVSTGRD